MRASADDLLARGRAVYDRPGSPLPGLARRVRTGGFAGGARWMAAALGELRGRPADIPAGISFQRLGVVKYALASTVAAVVATATVVAGLPWLAVLAVPAFYAAEVRMLFLFPVAIDGSRRPFRDARRLLAAAGGTARAVPAVMRIAGHMLFGGLVGHGFVRAWCVGCLAVCVWYEDALAAARAGPPGRPRLEVGGAGTLLAREERVRLGPTSAGRPLTLLYASDLHLGRPWTRRVADEVLAAARAARPDAILLGGDLVDCRRGLAGAERAVRALAEVAPVLAVAGNHDERVGVDAVRAAVLAGGGAWLHDGGVSLPGGAWLTAAGGRRPPAVTGAHVVCGHDPAEVAAADADVVLAGHLHGGQCVLAERGGRQYPGAWVNRWTGLRFDRDHPDGRRSTMLVSRGAADTLPVRWNCPREVLVVHLRPAASGPCSRPPDGPVS